MAFIVDIRRGNLDLHLAYKALFEMSADRAEFVSRMFSLPRPAGLTRTSTAKQIFDAYARVAPTEALYKGNLAAIYAHLTKVRGIDHCPPETVEASSSSIVHGTSTDRASTTR